MIQNHRVLTSELDEEIRKAMQEWMVSQCALLFMEEMHVVQRAMLDGKHILRKLKRCKWSVKMYGPQEHRGTMTTAYNIGQVADYFTAYALHLCLKRAHLPWTTPVKDILPDFNIGPQSSKCTLADLASHRAGIGAWPVVIGHATRDNITHVLANLPPARGFRTGRLYSGLTVLLLQHIIEVMEKKYFAGDADGRPRSYEAFCKAEIFDPLGLDASFSPPEGASRGHSQVSSDRLFRCDPQECVGGLWMNGQDMCKWLQLAPMMAGFRDICQHHMEHPSEELKDDWRRNGQGCMAVTFSDVGVPYLESEVSGFATGVYWLPQGHGTVGIMINNDRCGTALRKLIDERIGENLRGVAKAESFERIALEWRNDSATIPRPEARPINENEVGRLVGSWTHPSFKTIHVSRDCIVDRLPELLHIPPSPLQWKLKRIVLAPAQEPSAYDGCFEIGEDGKTVHGRLFRVVLGQDGLTVIGWNGDELAINLRRV